MTKAASFLTTQIAKSFLRVALLEGAVLRSSQKYDRYGAVLYAIALRREQTPCSYVGFALY